MQRRHEQADREPHAEELVDGTQPLVGHQVGHVLAHVGAAFGDEEPAHVRVKEVLDRGHEAFAVADVWAVRVALLVGELMVLAVIGDPGEHGAFYGHRAQDRKGVAHPGVRLERPVREEAVVADGDAHARQHVADGEQDQVVGADPLVPEKADRSDEADERQDDSQQVRDLVSTCHGSYLVLFFKSVLVAERMPAAASPDCVKASAMATSPSLPTYSTISGGTWLPTFDVLATSTFRPLARLHSCGGVTASSTRSTRARSPTRTATGSAT